MYVFLNAEEIKLAERLGQRRHEDAMKKNKRDFIKDWKGRSSEDRHRDGILAEAAAARVIGYKWYAYREGSTDRKRQGHLDVGPIEVRWGALWKDLLIKGSDKLPGTPFLLVYQKSENCWRLEGWFPGDEVRDEHWHEGKRYAYVKRHELYDIPSLEQWCLNNGYPPWKSTPLAECEIMQ